MTFTNTLTTKRLQKEFADLIVSTMKHENISLLEAYVTLSQLMSSDAVVDLAKAKVAKLNGQVAESREQYLAA